MNNLDIAAIGNCSFGALIDKRAAQLDLAHICVGDILRWNIQSRTKLAARIRRVVDAGGLVPDEIVEHIVDLMAPQAVEKGLGLSTDFGSKIPRLVTGDPVRLRQILINLVSNAIKFTDQGTITINLNVKIDHEIRLKVEKDIDQLFSEDSDLF